MGNTTGTPNAATATETDAKTPEVTPSATEPTTETPAPTAEANVTPAATENGTETPAPAAEPAPTETPTEPTTEAKADEPADEPLTEAGKRALEAEREAKKALERDLAALRGEFETYKSTNSVDALTAERDELKAEVDALKADAQAGKALDALTELATAEGLTNKKLFARVVDVSAYDATKDNAAELIAAAKAEFPELFPGPAATPGLGSQDGPAASGKQTRTFTRAQVGRMSPAEYEANRDQILASRSTW